MAKGINKAILLGYLGADPEFCQMLGGKMVARISLKTSYVWEDKQNGEIKTLTEWNQVILLDQLAENMRQQLRQGAKVYIEGQLRTRKWQDNQGVAHYSTEVIAHQMQLLEDRSYSTSHLDNLKSGPSLVSLSESLSSLQPLEELAHELF